MSKIYASFVGHDKDLVASTNYPLPRIFHLFLCSTRRDEYVRTCSTCERWLIFVPCLPSFVRLWVTWWFHVNKDANLCIFSRLRDALLITREAEWLTVEGAMAKFWEKRGIEGVEWDLNSWDLAPDDNYMMAQFVYGCLALLYITYSKVQILGRGYSNRREL